MLVYVLGLAAGCAGADVKKKYPCPQQCLFVCWAWRRVYPVAVEPKKQTPAPNNVCLSFRPGGVRRRRLDLLLVRASQLPNTPILFPNAFPQTLLERPSNGRLLIGYNSIEELFYWLLIPIQWTCPTVIGYN